MSDLVVNVAVIFMLVVGLSFLFQTREWLRFVREAAETPHRFFTLSLLITTLGAAIVATHNDWSVGWELSITIYGWALLLKGATLLVIPKYPNLFSRIGDGLYAAFIRIGGVLLTVFGAILTYKVWFAA